MERPASLLMYFIIENTQRLSLRGKPLPNLASRAVFSRASFVARKICTNLLIIMCPTAVHAVYMARSLSKKSQVHVLVIFIDVHHLCAASSLANLHITTVGHGYSSNLHVDHSGTCHHLPLYACHELLRSYEPFTCHHRVFLWQAFPGDHPAP